MQNNMKQYQVVVVDVDGTLVTSDKHVTEKTKDAIIQYKKQGILFGVATGRPVSSALKMLKRYDADHLFDFLVCSNGVETFDLKTNTSIITHRLDKEDLITIFNYMKPLDVDYCLYDQGHIYTNNFNPIVKRISILNDLSPVICAIEDIPLQETHKIVFTIEPFQVDQVHAHKKTINDPRYSCFFSQSELFEFVDARVSKATGIQAYIEQLNVSMDQVVTFGDAENDADMLVKAGLGVAMGNALSHVQALADDVTKSNDEDGVAYYLDKLFG